MQYLQLFRKNNGCTNEPKCYVTRTGNVRLGGRYSRYSNYWRLKGGVPYHQDIWGNGAMHSSPYHLIKVIRQPLAPALWPRCSLDRGLVRSDCRSEGCEQETISCACYKSNTQSAGLQPVVAQSLNRPSLKVKLCEMTSLPRITLPFLTVWFSRFSKLYNLDSDRMWCEAMSSKYQESHNPDEQSPWRRSDRVHAEMCSMGGDQ